MDSEEIIESPPEKAEVENEIPGFLVSWQNPDGESEHGPLSVLWQLIESYKVDIFDVSLLKITDDFLQFIRSAGDLKIELVSSFAVMAARLLYYKSRALLPDPGFEEPDQDMRLPPELVQQLLEYRKFQIAAEKLRDLNDVTSGMFRRPSGHHIAREKSDDNEWLDVSLVDLIRAYAEIVKKIDEANAGEYNMEVTMEEFSVEEKVFNIRKLLEEAVSFAFEDLFSSARKKGDIIATFLAILELVKQGEIVLQQKTIFGEIRIFRKSIVVR